MVTKSPENNKKPHVVCVPCPAQGHINAMLKLANLLVASGAHVTFVHTEFIHKRIVTNSQHALAAAGGGGINYETIPDGLPESDDLDKNQSTPDLCAAMRNGQLTGPFRELVRRLNGPDSDVPKVSCVVSDTYGNYAADVAREMGIADVSFCSTAACGLMGSLSYEGLVDRGIVPLKSENDLINGYLDNTIIDWIPGMPKMPLKYLPSFLRTTDRNDIMFNFLKDEAQDSLKATTILINTFYELESPILNAMSSIYKSIYSIGPLNLLCNESESVRSSIWEEDSCCLRWLEGKKNKSIIYVNFGSLIIITKDQLVEFAWGLANSGYEFLWIIRPDVLVDKSAVLPEEFLEETRKRGMVAKWCAQEEVLRHSAIGGFLTHCGWNSTVEAMSNGIVMMCWPFFAEQHTNCRYVCKEWGMGIEVDEKVRREKVEVMIREVMEGESGKEMRRNASKWKESAIEATKEGGESYMNLHRFLENVVWKDFVE